MACRKVLVVQWLTMLAVATLMGSNVAKTPPKGVSIRFLPIDGKFTCSMDPAIGVETRFICTLADLSAVYLSNNDNVMSARYQYKTHIQLWKRGLQYMASFSAYFIVNFGRSSEYTVRDNFSGGGLKFAIIPLLSVVGMGSESFGLFPINEMIGGLLNGANTKTVAVEIDISHNGPISFDPHIPHIGLDINNIKSVKTKYLDDPSPFIDSKVYIKKVKVTETPKRQNANIAICYKGFDLTKEVNEFSYVGFSSRVPEMPKGVYKLYDFKFSTAWVLGSTIN